MNTIQYIQTLEELERIKDEWKKLRSMDPLPSHETDFEFFKTFITTATADSVRLFVVYHPLPQTPCIIVAYMCKTIFAPSFGYGTVRLRRKPLDCLCVVERGFLGSGSSDMAQTCVQILRHIIHTGTADYAYVRGVHLSSNVYASIQKRLGFFERDCMIRKEIHYTMKIPRTYEALLHAHSGKTSYTLRTLVKKTEKKYGTLIHMQTFTSPQSVHEFCRDAEIVAKKTYQRAIGRGFRFTPTVQRLLEQHAIQGYFHSCILYTKHKPIAFIQGTLCSQIFVLETLGYDQEYKKESMGTYLWLKLVARFCESQDVKIFDFGRGSDEYKKRFHDAQYLEAQIRIFPRTFFGVLMNIVISISTFVNYSAHCLTQRFDFYQRCKKAWRQKLISRYNRKIHE